MTSLPTFHDAVIVGAGHNGLVAACYLAAAGRRVLVLERNDYAGGATTSQRVFPDYEARLSRYAYLVSLLPPKIVRDLGLDLTLLQRRVASYTPFVRAETHQGLLLRNADEIQNRLNVNALHPDDYQGYQKLQAMNQTVAGKTWNSFLQPLRSRRAWEKLFATAEEKAAWRWLVERPVGELIEAHIHDDVLRGVLLTDAKIGTFTHAHDPSLLQNRTYFYHIVGNGTGEWRVPAGGMGSVAEALEQRARQLGVTLLTNAEVLHLRPGGQRQTVVYRRKDKAHDKVIETNATQVLVNAAPAVLSRLLNQPPGATPEDEGSVFKINLLLRKLPRLRQSGVRPEDAFAGTFHINQSYSQMAVSFGEAANGQLPTVLPGEIYCHTLTDASVLSPELARQGYHTLTFFGLDLPYRLFVQHNEAAKKAVIQKFLTGLNTYLDEPLESCLATDRNGDPCLEDKSPVDLEQEVGLPQGNIFHNALDWFFAENDAEAGAWGVDTGHENIYLCGSGARRGGAVSGIPGHNAAMRALGK